MLKRMAFGLTAVVIALMPLRLDPRGTPSVTRGQHVYGFNDKMLILHHGREICVDWWAWPGHMIQHGDTLVGSGSCDVPSNLQIRSEL